MSIGFKKLLITGGTGSFGNAVLSKFINSDKFDKIVIFSRDEKKQSNMRLKYISDKIEFCIGDVRDRNSVDKIMKTGITHIFHAAALKQVPSCEFYPMEAIKTNVLGTENVLESAIEYGVDKVICLSTDKAVYPINVMGMTKATMEKLALSKHQSGSRTNIMVTRYGNVMNSRGSVIPLFIDQILGGNNITVTNPNMTRFMMSLDDAIDLVLYAFDNGRNGRLFIKKAPACTIGQLANVLKQLFDSDVNIKTIGTRKGEKLYESLLTNEELTDAIDCGDYYMLKSTNEMLKYESYFSEGSQEYNIPQSYTSHNTYRLSNNELKQLLMSLPYIKNKLD